MKNKKMIAMVGVLLALVLAGTGLFLSVPEKKISSYSLSKNGYVEYVGGDAYNYIIEASLRGGEISGTLAMKGALIAGGAILLFLSLGMYVDAMPVPEKKKEANEQVAA